MSACPYPGSRPFMSPPPPFLPRFASGAPSSELGGNLLSPKRDTLRRVLCRTERQEASLMFREALVISVPFDLRTQKATSFRFENSDGFVYFVLGKPK